MIKNSKALEDLEKEEIRKEKPDHFISLAVFEPLWHEGTTLGTLPLKRPPSRG